MADIFLSYSHEDLATARRFAKAFERAGFACAAIVSGAQTSSARVAAIVDAGERAISRAL